MAEEPDQGPTVQELLAEVDRLRADLSERDGEVVELRAEVARANAELGRVKKPLEDRLARLEQDLEQAGLRGELTMLRALDSLRAEHRKALEREAERADEWIREIKKSHATEKTHLLERIAMLEREKVGVRGSDSTREHRGGVEPGGGPITITSETRAPSETTPAGGAVEAPLPTESLPVLEYDGAVLTLYPVCYCNTLHSWYNFKPKRDSCSYISP